MAQHVALTADTKIPRKPSILYGGPCPFLTELAMLVEEIADPEHLEALVILARFLAKKKET